MVSGAARYDGHSEWYDEHFGQSHRPAEELAFLREALGPGHGQVCVELACGTGLWAQPIAAAGYRTAGFDISALASFLGAIVSSGLQIREVREFASSGVVLPRNIGLVAERPQA